MYSNFTRGKRIILGFTTGAHHRLEFSTEIGAATETLPKGMNKDWEWFRFSSAIKPHLIPDGHGAYEVVIEV